MATIPAELYCRAAHAIVKELERQYRDNLRLVFRHFPLTQWHPLAHMAAQLAEAAAAFGRFWPMHEWLFENQTRWSEDGADELLSAIPEVGLETSAVEQVLMQTRIARRIEADFKSGLRSRVSGTPSFFVNGYLHQGAPQALGLVIQRIASTQSRAS
jgi:protein-disulfide isomerase